MKRTKDQQRKFVEGNRQELLEHQINACVGKVVCRACYRVLRCHYTINKYEKGTAKRMITWYTDARNCGYCQTSQIRENFYQKENYEQTTIYINDKPERL